MIRAVVQRMDVPKEDKDGKESKLHKHSFSPPDWRNYILRELKEIPIHHKFPKRSLQFLWDHMTSKQQTQLLELGISGPRDLKSLPFLLIKGQFKTSKKVVPPEKRLDDPDHPKSDMGKLEDLRKMLEQQLNKNPDLDLVFDTRGNTTPRSGVVIELNKVYREICFDFLDSKTQETYTIPDKLFLHLFAVIEEGIYTHFALSNSNELWTYDWASEKGDDEIEYFYLPPQPELQKPSLKGVKEKFVESEKKRRQAMEEQAKNSALYKRYRHALAVLEYWPPALEDQSPEEHMRAVIKIAFGSKDDEWSDV